MNKSGVFFVLLGLSVVPVARSVGASINGSNDRASVSGLSTNSATKSHPISKNANQTAGSNGSSCTGGKSDHLCLALKYAVYKSPEGQPVLSQTDALSNVKAINKVW